MSPAEDPPQKWDPPGILAGLAGLPVGAVRRALAVDVVYDVAATVRAVARSDHDRALDPPFARCAAKSRHDFRSMPGRSAR